RPERTKIRLPLRRNLRQVEEKWLESEVRRLRRTVVHPHPRLLWRPISLLQVARLTRRYDVRERAPTALRVRDNVIVSELPRLLLEAAVAASKLVPHVHVRPAEPDTAVGLAHLPKLDHRRHVQRKRRRSDRGVVLLEDVDLPLHDETDRLHPVHDPVRTHRDVEDECSCAIYDRSPSWLRRPDSRRRFQGYEPCEMLLLYPATSSCHRKPVGALGIEPRLPVYQTGVHNQ